MGQFSDDGQWWWDGKTWVATAQVVIPDLPKTEFETSGKLSLAGEHKTGSRWLFWTVASVVPVFPYRLQATRDYRAWTLEQLALATKYLLDAAEPMVAGEMSTYDYGDSFTRDLAVAVTAVHVVVFRFDATDGQPRWIALAARARDVRMELTSGVFGFVWPRLTVSGAHGRWTIQGIEGAFEPEGVIDAWQKATARTGTNV